MEENLFAFSSFRDHLIGQKQSYNGDESIIAKVIYKFNGKSLQEILNVRLKLTTFEYGQISIEYGNILNSDIVHMDFNSNYQKYCLSEENFLIIRGKSNKIGSYEVKIVPV